MNKTYEEVMKEQQEEFDRLPIFFAFSDKQLSDELGKRDVSIDDIYSGGGGCFWLKSDANIIHEFMEKENPIYEYMKDPEFAESAFLYEMYNHEYGINLQRDWDVLSCFSENEIEYHDSYHWKEYLKAMGHEEWIESYRKARKKYFAECEEKGL